MDQVRGRRGLSAHAGCVRAAIAALSLAFLLLALGYSKPSATQARPSSATPAAATAQAQTRADAPAVATGAQPTSIEPAAATPTEAARLPKLIDLGAKTCIPCKQMAPILEELSVTYAAHFGVQFIDVKENPSMAKQYGIRLIPTQIFYDAQGQELYRHVGFYSRSEILAKWKALGVDVGS